MTRALQDADCAKMIEQVLPAVHARLAATEAAIRNVQEEVAKSREEVAKSRDITISCFTSLQGAVADAFVNMGRTMGGGEAVMAGPATNNPPAVSSQQQQLNDNATMVQPPYVQMIPKHASLQGVWDEWHGLGRFGGVFEGGIQGLEKRYKSAWRKHIPSQHFSRTKRVVLGIRNISKDRGCAVEEAIAELEGEYIAANRSISNFVLILQQKGLLPKRKPRGRTKYGR